ncbi:MAG: phosphoheptose isomerase [Anaerolineae bacterium]|nr:phosphoheptose isomerase [Anaerolineae bacterium]
MPPLHLSLSRQPLRLIPNRVYRTYLGGRLIDELQGRSDPTDNTFPEEWVGSFTRAVNPVREHVVDEGLSAVALPDGSQATLLSLVQQDPVPFLGEKHVARFGTDLRVLVKLLDSLIRLPIQTHPDRAFSRRYLNSDYGKTESWLILNTRVVDGEEPYILLGFKPGIDPKAWRRLVDTQDSAGQVAALNRIPVRAGDVYFVPAGTPHAIGSGVFMVEVQEPSDWVVLTEFTVGDIKIPVEYCHMGLGFDLALQTFDYRGETVRQVQSRCKVTPRLLCQETGGSEWELIGPGQTPYFGAHRLDVQRSLDIPAGRCYLAIIIAGEGTIVSDKGYTPAHRGETFFLPATLGPHQIQTSGAGLLQVMCCYPPDPDGE